jgi:cell wall-associated NlpC family hydrolase
MRRRRSSSALIFLILACAAASAACASTGAVPKPFPTPGGSARGPAPPAPAATPADPAAPAADPGASTPPVRSTKAGFDGYALVGTALSLRGVPYRDGGTDPHGFDCSGFTQYVFSQYGVTLPRAVRDQFRIGKEVRPQDLEPGDIVFFSTTAPGPSHVAIAIGGDEFVHAPSSTGVVRVEHLSSTYWGPRFLAARRLAN